MVDPFRLRVMKAVCAQLKTITPANGFVHDLSDFTDVAGRPAERVFRGRATFSTESDPLPMLGVLEDPRPQPETAPSGNSPISTGPWRLLIQGFAQENPEHPLDSAYALSAEVVKALARAKTPHNILGLGFRAPCVMAMVIEPPVHRPPDLEGRISDVPFFLLGVKLTITENLEDPYVA